MKTTRIQWKIRGLLFVAHMDCSCEELGVRTLDRLFDEKSPKKLFVTTG